MKKAVIVMLAILLIPALASAQTQKTGRITGQVMSEATGESIEGALVTVMSPSLQGQRQKRTDETGRFLFGVLPVGSYRVTITAPGMKTTDVSFRLGLGQTVPINVSLEEGEELTEEVTVLGTSTKMETTAQGENFNLDTTVEELPLQDRTLEALAFNAPNMAPGPNAGQLRIAGANAFDTVVLLDGAEVSDPLFGSAPILYIEDAVEEVQVQTSGISARYGRFSGGVVNAITKSGGNEFTATARFEYDNESWNESTPWGEDRVDDLNWRGMFTFGGYVLKDRLWFFLGGYEEPETQNANTALNNETFITTGDEERWQYKLTAAVAPEHTIEGNFLDFERTTSNRAGLPAGDTNALGQRADPREIITFTYQGVFSPQFFADFQYTDKDVSIASGGDPSKPSPVLELQQFRVFNNHWWDFTDPSIRSNETASANLTYTFDTDTWGYHTLEGGIQYVDSTLGGDNRQSATGWNLLIFDAFDDIVVRDGAGAPIPFPDGTHFNITSANSFLLLEAWQAFELGADASTEYNALYLNDSIELGQWRFDVGLRYESYDGQGPLDIQTVDFSDVSPRFGVTYNLNPEWQLQATWGEYLARFNDNYSGEVSGVSAAPRAIYSGYIGPLESDINGERLDQLFSDPANWDAIAGWVDPEFPTTISSADLTSSFAQDLNLAVKHTLPNNSGTVELRYTHRSFNDLVDDFTGGDYQNLVTVDPIATDFDQTVWDNAGGAERKYDALSFTWDYRPSVRWNIGGSYTWSDLRGNYTGEGTNTPASGSQIGDYPEVLPQAATVPYGPLPGDITNRIRAWGNYRFDFGRWGQTQLGALFRFRSGAPWARTASVDVWLEDPDAVNEQEYSMTYFFERRGANRFPSRWALDFSVRHQFNVWSDLDAWLKVDATNVLNRDHEIFYDTSGAAVLDSTGAPIGFDPGGTFGQVTGPGNYQTPRTLLITAGLAWK